MRSHVASQANAVAEPVSRINSAGPVIQRKCACGGSAGAGGSCSECDRKSLTVQRSASNSGLQQRVSRLLSSMPSAQDGLSHHLLPSANEAEPTGSGQTGFAHDFGRVQLRPQEVQSSDSDTTPHSHSQQGENLGATPGEVGPAAPQGNQPATSEEKSAAGLIAEDDVQDLAPGQMRKSEFIDELQRGICAEADAELAPVGRSTAGCPYLDRWMSYYRSRSGQQGERSLRRYAPEAAGVTNARDYIPIVAARVRRAVSVWATSGQITGVPEELVAQVPPEVLPAGGVFAKAREGGAKSADPSVVQAQLRSGRPLDSAARSRMEPAFGHDFSHVRVHTDARAAGLATSLNARAFTIGRDIAFGPGEYQPSDPIGAALLAHELAHVVQQEGGVAADGPFKKEETGSERLEVEADQAAVGVVASLWSAGQGRVAQITDRTLPSIKSGLRLSRCPSTPTTTATAKTVTINITVLDGATDNSAADIKTSNDIYKGAGCALKVAAGNTPPPLNATDTTSILGSDSLLEEPAGATVSTEEQTLVTFNRSSGALTAYYVPGFNPSKRGTSLQSPRHGVPDSLIMGGTAAADTFTHELGHILARDSSHHSDADNLMASGSIRNVGKDNITTDQCEAFRTKTSYPT